MDRRAGRSEEAAARGVLLAPGDRFGVPGHFRIGLGAGGDDISQAVDRLSALPGIAAG